jgi:hypothetical protein
MALINGTQKGSQKLTPSMRYPSSYPVDCFAKKLSNFPLVIIIFSLSTQILIERNRKNIDI